MSVDLVPVQSSDWVSDLRRASLDELGEAATLEYAQASAHLAGALWHFIRLGDVFLEARSRLDAAGEPWIAWLRSIGIEHHFTADRAMRLAFYKDRLPPEAFEVWTDARGRRCNPSWSKALMYIRELPPAHGKRSRGYPPETVEEARRLVAEGLPVRDAAKTLGVGESTVRLWVLPGEKERVRRNQRAAKQRAQRAAAALRQAEQRAERDAMAVASGGEMEIAYGLLRRTLASLSKASSSNSPTVSAKIDEAIRSCHSAENRLIEAMTQSRVA